MSQSKETGFISHLTELRQRLINSIIFLFVLFVICYYFSEYIYGFLVSPYAQAVESDGSNRRLIFTALQELDWLHPYYSHYIWKLRVKSV